MSRRRRRGYSPATQFGAVLLLAVVVVVAWDYGKDAAAGSLAAAFSVMVSGVAGWVGDAWSEWRARGK